MNSGEEKFVSILWNSEELVILDKPAGVETVSETGGPSLLALARDALALPDLLPVHRLDRDTTGVQIFARSQAAAKKAEDAFRRREVEKEYLALCLGCPFNATGTIRRRLTAWSGGRRPVQVAKSGGLEAETAYRVLASCPGSGGDTALILFRPHQGRTHQIRVHAAAIGHPILGDDQYGDRKANSRIKALCGLARQGLHAWRIHFPWNNVMLDIEAPPPADMEKAASVYFSGWRDVLESVRK